MVIFPNIPPSLFWDVDISKLDWNRHQQLIVERVIQRRSLNAIKEVIAHYGIEEIRNILK